MDEGRRVTCMHCGRVMPEAWQQLSPRACRDLKAQLGIKPECVECLNARRIRHLGLRRAGR